VKGPVTASDRVTLEATSNVSGDLTASKLIVHEGATFVGKVNIGADAVKGGGSTKDGVPAAVAARMGNQTAGANGKH
jgi:cytoskeletal protein CcmA (bactofilin family)